MVVGALLIIGFLFCPRDIDDNNDVVKDKDNPGHRVSSSSYLIFYFQSELN